MCTYTLSPFLHFETSWEKKKVCIHSISVETCLLLLEHRLKQFLCTVFSLCYLTFQQHLCLLTILSSSDLWDNSLLGVLPVLFLVIHFQFTGFFF